MKITLSELEEKKAVRATLSGDTRAFGQLVLAYQDLVFTMLFKLLDNRDLASELAQETFVKAFKNLKRFDLAKSFKPWLLTIATNLAYDYLRQSKKTSSLEQILEEEPYLEPRDPNLRADPAYEAEHNQFQQALAKAVQSLPIKYRQAFLLRYQLELSYEEIGKIMTEKENNVKNLLFRSKERLRKLLFADGIKYSELNEDVQSD